MDRSARRRRNLVTRRSHDNDLTDNGCSVLTGVHIDAAARGDDSNDAGDDDLDTTLLTTLAAEISVRGDGLDAIAERLLDV